MSTNTQIIIDALQEAGILAAAESPSAEDTSLALRRLNQMLEMWSEDGLKLGYFAQSNASDTCPIPAWSERAVSLSLAVNLCTAFQVPVTAELAALANDAYTSLLRRVINMELEGADMRHLPMGSGRFGSGYDISTDH